VAQSYPVAKMLSIADLLPYVRCGGRSSPISYLRSRPALPSTALALLVSLTCGCEGDRRARQPVSPPAVIAGVGASRIAFQDVARPSGITFKQGHGGRSPLNILETAGHGCALLDADGDGWLDVLLVGQPRCALYRNLGSSGSGSLSFGEITTEAGLDRAGYWMGCAAADYDNDGRTDLLLTGYRCAALLHNEGGHFRDVGTAIPLARDAWSTSAGFLDYDRDGWLDLYVSAYVRFDGHMLQLCDFEGVKAACPPTYYDPEVGRLYRNLRNGRFVDVTREAGLHSAHGKTLGAAAADYDADGDTDLYLANDGMPGDLFRNEGGRFVDLGSESGTAFNHASREQAGMGVDWGDYDGDGRLDLVVTTFQYEPTSLYHNEGNGLFRETAFPAGVGDPTLSRLGFGARFFDADGDGDLDLVHANGHVQDTAERLYPGVTYAQTTQLFENQGAGIFRDVSPTGGAALRQPIVGRGLATGDIDNDGDLDVLVANLEGAPLLLRNDTPASRSLTVSLRGRQSARDGTGAQLLLRAGGRTQVREAGTGGSYLSASDPRVHFGLGAIAVVETLMVRWPSGRRQTLHRVPAGRPLSLDERDAS
jgi:enediyne biosynthesis protein E4